MSIKYVAAKKLSKAGRKEKIAYFPCPVTDRKKNAKNMELAIALSEGTSLSAGDILSVLEQLPEVLAKHLKKGQTVAIKNLGYFSLTLQSNGVDNPEELTPDKVSVGRVAFKADSSFSSEIKNNSIIQQLKDK